MSAACSVRDRCGPTGKACGAEDRACQSEAAAGGLEILCEDRSTEPATYVYCPTGTEARDSGVVWILLVVAFLVAAVGGAVLALALRRRGP